MRRERVKRELDSLTGVEVYADSEAPRVASDSVAGIHARLVEQPAPRATGLEMDQSIDSVGAS
jgi:hypothetical protein